jgi:ribosomal protein S27E
MSESIKCVICGRGSYIVIAPKSGPEVDESYRTRQLDRVGLESRKAGVGSQHLEVHRCNGCGNVQIFHHGS